MRSDRADGAEVDTLDCAVLIPTYNRCATVITCLEHLEAQTCGPERLEVIIVDDGSSDDTVATVSARRSPFARLEVFSQQNAGPGAARNLGLTEVRAPITLFINDDTLLAPGAIAAHLDTHRRFPRSMVLGTFVFVDDFLMTPLGRLLTEVPLLFSYPLFDDGDELSANLAATCNLSVESGAAKQAGFDPWFTFAAEDVDFALRLEEVGHTLRHCAAARARHDHHLTVEGLKRTAVLRGLGAAKLALKHNRHSAILSDVRAAAADRLELTRLFDEAADTLHGLLGAVEGVDPIPEPAYRAASKIFTLGNMLGYLDEPTIVALASEPAEASA